MEKLKVEYIDTGELKQERAQALKFLRQAGKI